MPDSFKRFIDARIAKRGIRTRADFCKSIGIAITTLNRAIEKPQTMRVINLQVIASALGYPDWESLQSDFAGDKPKSFEPSNIDPFSERKVPEIPLIKSSIACSAWQEHFVDEEDFRFTPAQIERGLFKLRLRGDSMAPDCPDGSIVVFRLIRPEREETLSVGSCYAVTRSDGYSTFKMLWQINDEQYIFRALNKKKYPKPMPVDRVEVVRMAIAEDILIPLRAKNVNDF